jgi:hypothetical protein
LAISEKGPAAFYINKQDRALYEELLRDKNSPFREKDNKDVFLMAMTIGFAEGLRMKLDKREGFFRAEYLKPKEWALIAAVSVADKGNLNPLLDKKEEYAIAEEYAAGGVRLLKDKVFGGDFGSYGRKLESELLNAFGKITKEQAKPRPVEELSTLPITDLIGNGETDSVELKSSLVWDFKMGQPNKKLMAWVIAKSMSSFMNSNGGIVLIGVDNEKNILGLDKDFKQLGDGRDIFELHLTNIINSYLGKICRSLVSVKFKKTDSKDVAIVQIRKSPRPVYVKYEGKTEFYIRSGNSCQPLDVSEVNPYIEDHWPNL